MEFTNLLGGLAVSMGIVACASGGNRDVADTTRTQHFLSWTQGKREIALVGCNDGTGGKAFLQKVANGYMLSVRSSSCANIIVAGEDTKLAGEGNRDRKTDVFLRTPGYHRVVLGSNKYVKSDGREGQGDIFNIHVPPTMVELDLRNVTGSEGKNPLYSCGGSVRAKIAGGAVNVIHEGVDLSKCDTFDILFANGDSANYQAKVLNGPSGSFTISNKFYEKDPRGMPLQDNAVVLNFYKQGQREDRVLVKFLVK